MRVENLNNDFVEVISEDNGDQSRAP